MSSRKGAGGRVPAVRGVGLRAPWVTFLFGFALGAILIATVFRLAASQPDRSMSSGDAQPPVAAQQGPSLVLDQTSIDLGAIGQSEPVEHSLTFTNSGDAPLVIEEVSAT